MYKKILLPIALDHEHDPQDSIAIAKGMLAPEGDLILMHVVGSCLGSGGNSQAV